MKVSLSNFKAIKKLREFELKPITILSGTNSTGKSSFIQFLLLIKQTLELDSSTTQLALDGEYFESREFIDLVHNKLITNNLSAEFLFDKKELMNLSSRLEVFDSLEYKCKVILEYKSNNGKPFISKLAINYLLEGDQKKDGQFVIFESSLGAKNRYSIKTNNELFVKNIWNTKAKIEQITYSGIFPSSYDIIEVVTGKGPKGGKIKDTKKSRYFTNIDSIRDKVVDFFRHIAYIGPLRDSPKDVYNIRGKHKSVGAQGENVAAVLNDFKDVSIQIFKPSFSPEGIIYRREDVYLLEAVNFWVCEIFKLARNITSSKAEDIYSILIESNSGVVSTIKHVGFGISQILPIIVEGLLLKKGATLVLEQPEIHLHPKIQSLLFDFLRAIMLNEVNVIIETHSDHFITRLRRRVAEDETNKLTSEVSLTFIEPVQNEILFRTIEMDDSGALEYFPSDFMEQLSIETKAILRAQLRKQVKKSN